MAFNARCLNLFRLSVRHPLLYGESRPGVGDNVVETDRGSSINDTSDAHTLCILMYFLYCRPRARSCIMSDFMYFPFQCCMMVPACGTSFIGTCVVFQCICTLLFMIIYIFSLPRHISPLCSYSVLVLLFFSAVYSLSEYYFVSA